MHLKVMCLKIRIIPRSYLRYSTSSIARQKFKLPCRYDAGVSIWNEYSQLVAELKPKLNLGQGFPDYEVPKHFRQMLADVANSKEPLLQQYTRGHGHLKLVQGLARLYSPLIQHNIDPVNEFIITIGAYEALSCTILGHVEEGDEVIIMEPFFDCYAPMVKGGGGISKFIPLRPIKPCGDIPITSADWVFDNDELASLFNDRTKMIIVNTPHNPLGKVFTREELSFIAELCKKYDVLCVMDEVYEWTVFHPAVHVRMASLPGMWERTITISSVGKVFSVTGWKTGWAYGPAPLMQNLQVVHQNSVYTCCTPIQEAITRILDIEAARLGTEECYFCSLSYQLVKKRDLLIKALMENGFKPTLPEGGYFIVAEWTDLQNKIDITSEPDIYDDYKFSKKFAKEASIVTIPTTAFYHKGNKKLGENYVRFCFNKKISNLQLAEELLKKWNAKKK